MDYKFFDSLIAEHKYAELKKELDNENAVDIAEYLDYLDKDKSVLVFRLLPKDVSVLVFSYLSVKGQQDIVETISDGEAAEIIEDLNIDDAVDFFEEVPAFVVKKVLSKVENSKRNLINQFLNYEDDTAGSIMTAEFVDLFENYSVEQAIERIRKIGKDKETIYCCYVVSEKRHLLGIISLRTLLVSEKDVLIKDLMDKNVVKAFTHDDQEVVADTIRKYDLLAIPVVDNENRLVGIVTVDDAMDVIEEENTEDFEVMAAMSPSEDSYLDTSVAQLAKNRLFWLMFLMISGSVTQIIIGKFEHVLSSAIILTSFIPMLTDTGGNAGSQSSTLIIRGMAVGELKISDYLKVFWKEFRVSLICGVVLSFVNFLKTYFINKAGFEVSLVVSISLLFIVILAKVIGGLLPIIAKKLKLDPALMASPLITTIVDSLGLVVYFSLAGLLIK